MPATEVQTTTRKSKLALAWGLNILMICLWAARFYDVDSKDLLSILASGLGAIGALMAAYEAADAAHKAADATEQSIAAAAASANATEVAAAASVASAKAADHANELTARQLEPHIHLTGVALTLEEDGVLVSFLGQIAIDNIGSVYTASKHLTIYVYIDGVKTKYLEYPFRIPLRAGAPHIFEVSTKSNKYLLANNIDGYGVEMTTIHDMNHCCIGWSMPKRRNFYSVQFDGSEVPKMLPQKPKQACEDRIRLIN